MSPEEDIAYIQVLITQRPATETLLRKNINNEQASF